MVCDGDGGVHLSLLYSFFRAWSARSSWRALLHLVASAFASGALPACASAVRFCSAAKKIIIGPFGGSTRTQGTLAHDFYRFPF